MSYHNEFGAMILIALTLVSSFAFAEMSGTINLSYVQNSSPIVTGLRGETLATTTSTTVANSSSSSSSDSSITTTNSTTTTTATAASTTIATTTSILPYSHYSAGQITNNFSAEYINSSIANNTNLSNAITRYIGNISAIDILASTHLSDEISIIKSMDVYQNTSRLDVRIFFNGTNEIKNVMIYDLVPKSFATNAGNITVESDFEYIVVENDPSFAFFIPSLKQNDMISIEYSVNKKVNSAAINHTSIAIFAGSQGYSTDMWLMGIAIILIAAIAAIVILVKSGKISPEYFKDKPKYKTEYVKSGKKLSEFEKIIEKIKKMFEKKGGNNPVIFRYLYKK